MRRLDDLYEPQHTLTNVELAELVNQVAQHVDAVRQKYDPPELERASQLLQWVLCWLKL